jgi:hypothetical protein
MAIKKHVGKIKSTDTRCVIAFMQLPDNKEKALIIDVEALPPRYEQLLLSVVDSAEGQAETDLASAMARRVVQDTGNTVLVEFHRLGMLRAESIDNIILLPQPNTPYPLRDILEQLGRLAPTEAAVASQTAQTDADVKYNPVINNMNAAERDQRAQQAINFIAEAEMLEAEANKKREQAYRLVPEMRPAPRKVFHVETGNMNAQEAAAKVEATLTEAKLESAPKKRGRKPKVRTATNG